MMPSIFGENLFDEFFNEPFAKVITLFTVNAQRI